MASSSTPAGPARARVIALARVAALAGAAALAGCGGGGTPAAMTGAAAPVATGHPLGAGQLRVQVASAFRRGLYRLAVMDQPGDESADLGQELPTGRVRQVDCTPSAAATGGSATTSSSCVVRWEQVSGRAERTRLSIRQDRHGCWDATPRPPLPSRFDSTINSYSENPLNVLSSVRRGC